MKQAGYAAQASLFTDDAIKHIYEHTQGYPRKIALLCHDCVETVIMEEKTAIDRGIVQAVIDREVS